MGERLGLGAVWGKDWDCGGRYGDKIGAGEDGVRENIGNGCWRFHGKNGARGGWNGRMRDDWGYGGLTVLRKD